MGTWKCTKCGTSTWSTRKPLNGVCVKGGGHRWTTYDSNKVVVWRCGKCGNTTTSANRPLDRLCSRGGRCSWRKS